MDSKFQMAWREGRHLLLGSSRHSLPLQTSPAGDKRKKAATADRKAKGSKAKDSKAKSKVSAEAKGIDGSTIRDKGNRHHDKDRKPDRGTEGKDRTAGRSASKLVKNTSELGIEYVDSFCPDGQPHFFKPIFHNGIFKCCKCYKHKWMPAYWTEAQEYAQLVKKHGVKNAYLTYLDSNRDTRIMIAKLQHLWYAKQRITDQKELVQLVISVMSDDEYDKKEAQCGLESDVSM